MKIKTLLEKVGILNLSYEKLKDDNEFNIFTLLRKYDDEVNLHSKFIYELLNPFGTHRKKTEFLQSFLDVVEIEDFSLNEVRVLREHEKIDILIIGQSQAVIIENKIGADDQKDQLERYYNKIKKNNHCKHIWIIYLTLNGDMPTKRSLGKLPDDVKKSLLNISYSFHVSEWLEKCISKSSRNPMLRETIIQYNNLVNEITGKSMSKELSKEVYELLSQQDNVHNAYTITSNWKHIKWYLEWDFWTDFEKVISDEYEILPIQKYSTKTLNSAIHKSRNRNMNYGLMFEIFSIKDDKFCLFIERGEGNVYYGITILSDDKRDTQKHEEYSEFAKKMNEFTEQEKRGKWLGRNYLHPHINFNFFSSEATLNLIKKEDRSKYIEKNWKVIKEFIEKVKNIKVGVK